ncbi:MAG: hypothetical protein QJR00_03500 [Bacillota bacterium]|nr:hypothetical protein [Bacillota bacterium]
MTAVFVLLYLVAFLLLAFWIYGDAEARDMVGIYWVLALLFGGVLAPLFIYLAIRDSFWVRGAPEV